MQKNLCQNQIKQQVFQKMVRKNLPTTTIEREKEADEEWNALYWEAYQLGVTQAEMYSKEKLQKLIELKKKENPN